MSKVKITGNASGTGVLTVTAPDTDVDREITLPDAAGTLLTSCVGNVAFPATQVASADANTLDDYEEGTFTPALNPGSGSTQTYSEQIGYYTKIGRKVHIFFRLNMSSLGDATGNAGISGLPFTSNATSNYNGFLHATNGFNLAITAGTNLSAFVNFNNTTVNIQNWDSAGGTTAFTTTELSADGLIVFAGSYIV